MTEIELQKLQLKHIKNNLLIYQNNKELILLYEQYLEKIVELLDFIMDNKNDLLYTVIFDILIEIGYFSFNNSFDSNQDTIKELTIKPGISVINGEGVCRNISCFYEDIFQYFYQYPLKMCCLDQNDNRNTKDTTVFGNHMINLVYYHDLLYGFDLTNHCLFKPINSSELELINNECNYKLIYKPYGDILINLTTNLSQKDIISETTKKQFFLKRTSKKKGITEEEYQKIIQKANNFIKLKSKIFKGFLKDNQKYKIAIKEKMLSLK